MGRQRGRSRAAPPRSELRIGSVARFDLERPRRTGVPEVILAEGKSAADLVRILEGLHRAGQGAFVSRLADEHRTALRRAGRTGLPVRLLARGSVARLDGPLGPRPATGPVAVLTAGTSDRSVADEAVELLEGSGVDVIAAHDVGVAGLHRLVRALHEIEPRRPRIYLVFAGREGALPTVVAGLVRAPVIGVPTSQGYGRGGRGEAALNAMLQSCAPIAVVNIDGGVPAALFALQLLARPSPDRHRTAPRARRNPR